MVSAQLWQPRRANWWGRPTKIQSGVDRVRAMGRRSASEPRAASYTPKTVVRQVRAAANPERRPVKATRARTTLSDAAAIADEGAFAAFCLRRCRKRQPPAARQDK